MNINNLVNGKTYWLESESHRYIGPAKHIEHDYPIAVLIFNSPIGDGVSRGGNKIVIYYLEDTFSVSEIGA